MYSPIKSIKISKNNIVFLDINRRLSVSKDGGNTWEINNYTGQDLAFRDDNNLYLIEPNSIYSYKNLSSFRYDLNLTNYIVNAICFEFGTGLIVGNNGLILKYSLYPYTNWIGFENGSWSNFPPDSNSIVELFSEYKSSLIGALKVKKLTIKAALIIDSPNSLDVDSVFCYGNSSISYPVKVNSVTGPAGKLGQVFSSKTIGVQKVGSVIKLNIQGPLSKGYILYGQPDLFRYSGDSIYFLKEGKLSFNLYHPGNMIFRPNSIQLAEIDILSTNQTGITKIYPWFENKTSATVLTYDDWSPGQAFHGIREIMKRNIVASFAITSLNVGIINVDGYSDNYALMEAAVSKGVEINNHTESHPDLTSLSDKQLSIEIDSTKSFLDKFVTNQKVSTFIYPLGSYDERVINAVKKIHIAARIVESSYIGWAYNFAKTEDDYFKIPTIAVNNKLGILGFTKGIRDGIIGGGLVTFMFHSINGEGVTDTWWDAITASKHREMLDSLLNYKNKTWITTFTNAVKYHKEKNCASITTLSDSEEFSTLQLTDTLSNNSLYNHPLSISYTKLDNTVFKEITQGGKSIPFRMEYGTIYFNAVPDGGDIVLHKDKLESLSVSYKGVSSVYPNPSSGEFVIHTVDELVDYQVNRIDGTIVDVNNFYSESPYQHKLIIQEKGVFCVKINTKYSQKIVKLIVY